MNQPIATFKFTDSRGKTNGEFRVYKRTFEAKSFPKDSEKRKQLNLDNITSEYMVSYKFSIKGENLSITSKTKDEAFATAQKYAGIPKV